MIKEEFIKLLEESLQGEVSSAIIQENIRYYREYINDEMRKGYSEQEVLDSIGDPRLIAKTIIDASSLPGEKSSGRTAYEDDNIRMNTNIHYFDLSKWYWKLAFAAIIIAVIMLVLTIVTGVVSFILPIIGPLIVIIFIYRMVKNMKW